MKIKVTKCDNGNMWYKSHIGETFEIGGEYDDAYSVNHGCYYKYEIYKNDCEVVTQYPMDYTAALHAMIDGKTVEDSDGLLVKFDAPHFYCKHSHDTEFIHSHYVFTHSLFREYTPKPKFKRGDFVEYGYGYYKVVSSIINDGKVSYEITRYSAVFDANIGGYACNVHEGELKEAK